ncbi:hypothetical protein AB5I41_29090 [Sphingomonas sp. MMS24-JH45]
MALLPAAAAPDTTIARAERALGGRALIDRVRALAWTGEAEVTLPDRTLVLRVETRIEPFVRARSTSWVKAQGRATARTLVVEPDDGFLLRGGARSPLPAAMVAHERAQYGLYGHLLLKGSLRAEGGAIVSTRAGFPEARLTLGPDGRVVSAAMTVPDAEDAAGTIREQIGLDGWSVTRGSPGRGGSPSGRTGGAISPSSSTPSTWSFHDRAFSCCSPGPAAEGRAAVQRADAAIGRRAPSGAGGACVRRADLAFEPDPATRRLMARATLTFEAKAAVPRSPDRSQFELQRPFGHGRRATGKVRAAGRADRDPSRARQGRARDGGDRLSGHSARRGQRTLGRRHGVGDDTGRPPSGWPARRKGTAGRPVAVPRFPHRRARQGRHPHYRAEGAQGAVERSPHRRRHAARRPHRLALEGAPAQHLCGYRDRRQPLRK